LSRLFACDASVPAKKERAFIVDADLDGASSKKGDNDGDDVDGQLELEELGDAVVHVATPHHRFHDTRKVVVRQNDVRRLLRHVRPCYSLYIQHASSAYSE